MGFANSSSDQASPPSCFVLTGPRRALKTRWLQETIRTLRADHRGARIAVLTAEDDWAVLERFATIVPDVTVRRLFLPCPCCPPAADLPRCAQEIVAANQPDWILIELPVLSAAGLLREFDVGLRWPREIVVCLDEQWATARQNGRLSDFQTQIVELADRLISPPDVRAHANAGQSLGNEKSPAVPVLTLS